MPTTVRASDLNFIGQVQRKGEIEWVGQVRFVAAGPLRRSEVAGYFKLHKQIQRSIEITELEKQWVSG